VRRLIACKGLKRPSGPCMMSRSDKSAYKYTFFCAILIRSETNNYSLMKNDFLNVRKGPKT
jgi:hypothetical protein